MESDDLTPRIAPRNVPTLTEVMQQPGSAGVPLTAGAAEPAPPPAAPPADAGQLLERLGPDLDRQIAEAIGRVLHEQLLGLNGRVQKAVAEVVREAVAKALTQDAHGSAPRENP